MPAGKHETIKTKLANSTCRRSKQKNPPQGVQICLIKEPPTFQVSNKLSNVPGLDKMFTIKKVKAAFAHMGSYKSAGPDGFKPIVMKHFGPIALGCITNIFQAIYSTGYIPIEFRKSKVVFIPKPLKNYYGEAGSFRPISLTHFLFKTMESVIEWSLCEHADKMGQISDLQHAYTQLPKTPQLRAKHRMRCCWCCTVLVKYPKAPPS